MHGLSRDAASEPIDFHGLPAIRWHGRDGAAAVATLQGAHLVSWIPAGGEERLFVSERSAFEPGKAIRGGIPVVFPQFADRGALRQHGFARTASWTFAGASAREQGPCATFRLTSSGATRALWPYAFELELAATVGGSSLDVELTVVNPGDAPWSFTAALHTYLRISSLAGAKLKGLHGIRFLERGSRESQVERRDIITPEDPIDRVYFAAPSRTVLEDESGRLAITQRGFTDTVVWNPGAERAASMPDMPPDGHRRMFCIEAAAVEPPIVLGPGERWQGAQALRVEA